MKTLSQNDLQQALAGQGLVGKEIGVSDWFEVSQDRIDIFADVTNDHQFIHVDPQAAKETPFGGTIAHGFLSLSMLSYLSLIHI